MVEMGRCSGKCRNFQKRFFAKGAGADPTGTGLGLTSVREAVAKFKGEVQIQSSPEPTLMPPRIERSPMPRAIEISTNSSRPSSDSGISA